ncbi:DNA topoisomerase I [Adlercreutzia faecimuris]|uniref:DNA topoisomerase 1 n=1 Tax=Adlercreutzia faecimuris TaxID=2897341 RepID=A0ABS9WG17_9ACTN|nr:DNA topoisomerase I [Adlercreutzia sp. JBNU-10]MCI2241804.1 DNA topoisomerase I [Adlercreutzia sp. JBNU-10]
MKLVVTEKNDAAQKIADLLGATKPKADKVFSTPVYRFDVDGEEWVTIGLRGHILEPDFAPQLVYKKRGGWQGVTAEGEAVPADIPATLARPPFKKKKPFTEDGVELKSWKMEALPYLVYAPIEKLPKEKDIIRSLKNLAKKADSIVIATDFDREGELIGADALACCREVNPTAPVSRARYSAFTKAEIQGAFSNLVAMDEDLAQAGASRQDIDLIWGAVLTRYLTLVKFAGYGNVRSSGRVQTPTLALIVARERERMAFVPEDYWVIRGAFDADATAGPTAGEGPGAFEAGHATARFKSAAAADAAMAAVAGAASARVAAVETKRRTVAAPVPFNTTSLLAAASSEGLSPARTMRLAESLYMDGYISYPRVDNTVYPSSLDLAEVVRTIADNPAYAPYCKELLAKGALTATRGKKETTDHPPIYPTAKATPDDLPPAEYKLYNLVARRFLATLSDPAVVEGTKVSLDVAGEPFVAKGDVLAVPGFRAIYPYGLKKDETLPALAEGATIAFNGATCAKKQTEPPARYSQGKLIQEMEKLGLGTKSTRHAIIERLYQVKYIQNDPIEPSQLGMAVVDALDKFAPHITHPDMTADLEQKMDDIAAGATTREAVVGTSRNLLSQELGELLPHSEDVKEALADAVAADAYVGKCPKCGKDLQIRASQKTKSMFIGCAGWPDCDVTYPLPKGKIESVPEPCPTCGMPQVKVTAFRAKPRTVCIDPACATNQEPDVVVGECPVCKAAGKESKLVARRNPRTLKRSVTCENFDECGTRYPLPQYGALTATDEVCEACGAPMVIVTTARGPWKLCPNFDCPAKEQEEEKKAGARKGGAKRKPAAKKASKR